MGCLCFPTSTPHHREHRSLFHWPNFTYSHDHDHDHTINPRQIHDTFDLQHPGRPGVARRRHTLHNGTTVATLRKSRKSKHSIKTTKTAPADVPETDMGDQYAPPPGPPPGYQPRQAISGDRNEAQHVHWPGASNPDREQASRNPFHSAHMNAPQAPPPSDAPPAYQPPPGPPQTWQNEKKQPMSDSEYAPPPGPPPTWQSDRKQPMPDSEYAPPPGPPPSQASSKQSYALPPGPPPSHNNPDEPEPPPYDPWMAVPDNALLPPPPSMFEERSPTANATYDDAARAHAWCRQTPLWRPQRLPPQTLHRIKTSDIHLTAPPGPPTKQKNIHILHPSKGTTRIKTTPNCPDTLFLSDLPLYTPLLTTSSPPQPQTIYYELKILSLTPPNRRTGDPTAGIALGFAAPPYPPWRLPGWHRGSLAVHGDDGRRYTDNSFGGQDFTSPFKTGDTVGIGMTISPAPPSNPNPNPNVQGAIRAVKVFFTRNGRRDGGWDVHEERDREADAGDVRGLEGWHDLCAAVGVFGGAEFEVRMGREGWAFKA